jgi:hypothetical protein
MNVLANRLATEAGPQGKLPIARFERILSSEITKPTVRAAGKLEPSLQDSAYIDALRKVKNETIDDVAAALGSRSINYTRARLAARKELTALENLRRKLFTRDRSGALRPRPGAIGTVRSIFKRAELGDDTVLRTFEEFDEVTGADVTPRLRELSMKRELTPLDTEQLVAIDGVVRTMAGLRSGLAELARYGARSVGKAALVTARPVGASAGIAGQKLVEQPFAELGEGEEPRLRIRKKQETTP